jgi:hypothetical protein
MGSTNNLEMAYLINQNPPKRPPKVEYTCMRELYLAFEEIFLCHGGNIQSKCGHALSVFDHHFFHMAAVTVQGIEKLFMKHEKERILALDSGFGLYDVGPSRAQHLRSAHLTVCAPDEVWVENPKAKAKWVYVKEFDSKPYPFSVALITERPDENYIIVPVSSFPCKKGDIKKWRKGTRIHP